MHDRPYYRDGGGRGVWRRMVGGGGESFFDWALPLYRAWGIEVRLHLFFILFVASRLIGSVKQGSIGFWYESISLAMLFGMVLLHEYGHCVACRRYGGAADRILLWPLGGLAMCAPPFNWRAHLATAAGGPLVNVMLFPLLGGLVLSATRDWSLALYNPFDPGAMFIALRLPSGGQPVWLVFLAWAHYMNAVLLLFNVLTPMYPMDGARLLQCLLWSRMGYRRSMEISLTIGFVAAVVMAVVAVSSEQPMLLGLAVFGAITCVVERQKLRMAGPEEESPWAASLSADPASGRAADRGPSRAEVRRARAEAQHRAEVDRILVKISTEGMASLTRSEKKTLQRDTEEKRQANARR